MVDDSDEAKFERCQEVQTVLESIGAGAIPQLLVHNKIDLSGATPRVERNGEGRVVSVAVSSRTGAGVIALRDILAQHRQLEYL